MQPEDPYQHPVDSTPRRTRSWPRRVALVGLPLLLLGACTAYVTGFGAPYADGRADDETPQVAGARSLAVYDLTLGVLANAGVRLEPSDGEHDMPHYSFCGVSHAYGLELYQDDNTTPGLVLDVELRSARDIGATKAREVTEALVPRWEQLGYQVERTSFGSRFGIYGVHPLGGSARVSYVASDSLLLVDVFPDCRVDPNGEGD